MLRRAPEVRTMTAAGKFGRLWSAVVMMIRTGLLVLRTGQLFISPDNVSGNDCERDKC